MTGMKKHLFLDVDYVSTVGLTQKEHAQIKSWLILASGVMQKLVAQKMLKDFSVEKLQLSLLICGDSRMKVLNREHRQKDKVTDVLSFPSTENLRFAKSLQKGPIFLGDLAICWPQAKRQAREFEIGLFDEFIHLFFHGVLHLMGFDHELSQREENIMSKWEKLALDEFSKLKKASR
jgi:rRNA maturation RNase YbeY